MPLDSTNSVARTDIVCQRCVVRVACGLVQVLSDQPDEALPTELRLLHFGVNETSHGPIVLTTASAEAIMKDYARKGIDLMIDLEHDSINSMARAQRADAADAYGWFRPEVREDGLYAASIRWTPGGEDQLRSRKRRYVSPLLDLNGAREAIALVNMALTSMPATFGAAPLMAASQFGGTNMWTTEQIQAAIDALTAGDGAAALEILKALLVSAAGGDAPESSGGESGDASAGAPDADGAALTALAALVGTAEPGAIVERVRALHATAQAHEASQAALALGARKELVSRLVALRAETPATAFADGQLVPRLAQEPLDSLRARVTALSASVGAPPSAPPKRTEGSTVQLSAVDEALMATMTDAQKARFVALRTRRAGQ